MVTGRVPNFEVEIGPLAVRVPGCGRSRTARCIPCSRRVASISTRPIRSMPACLLPQGRPHGRDPGRGHRGHARRRMGLSGYSSTTPSGSTGPVSSARAPCPPRRLMSSGAPASATGTATMHSWHLAGASAVEGLESDRARHTPTLHYPGARPALEPLPASGQTRLEPGVSDLGEERLPDIRLRSRHRQSNRGPEAPPPSPVRSQPRPPSWPPACGSSEQTGEARDVGGKAEAI